MVSVNELMALSSGIKQVEGNSMVEHKKLSVGDKYLSVKVNVGGVVFSLPAFKNREKKNPAEPDYKGQNVAVWISVKKASPGVKEDFVEGL